MTIPHTVPTGRVAFFLDASQAINCLATIMQSLRDKFPYVPPGQVPTSPSGTNKPSVRAHIFDSTSQNIFEDEDDDEDEDESSTRSPLPDHIKLF